MSRHIINLMISLTMICCFFGSSHGNNQDLQSDTLTFQTPVLVFDNVQNNTLINNSEADHPKRYRHGYDLSPKLSASASAQPNLLDLQYIIATAKKIANICPNKVFIVDLRQEPHGILNDNAISWYGNKNKVKHALETSLIQKLAEQKTARVYTGINKLPDGHFVPKAHINVKIHQIITEKTMVTNLGANYFRMLIQDHFAPDDPQIDIFVNFVRKIPDNAWLHFHCRGGRGRSTTLMAMFDMIINKGKLTFEEILLRQQQIGGIVLSNVKFEENYKQWKEPAANDRYHFIKKFYDYVADPYGYTRSSWSEWIQQNK